MPNDLVPPNESAAPNDAVLPSGVQRSETESRDPAGFP